MRGLILALMSNVCYLAVILIFLVVTARYPVATSDSCSLPGGYCSLLVVITRYRSLLLVPTFSVIYILHRTKNSNLFNTKNSNLYDKNCTQENVKCHIQHEECWLRWIVIEQANYKYHHFPLIFPGWKKWCSHTFKVSSKEAIVIHSDKMKAKYMKKDVSKSTFRKLAGWNLATLLQINFFTDNFQRFKLHERLRTATSRSCIKCLKSTCEIIFCCVWWLKFCNLYMK